ncbi:hypothetical protein [Vibrio harveyi]|uniref:hypothetical protein n=1 Tax=Vibrio harveyi TaxID=669 RepID=UPI002480857C|nr:hypothetical protein [Vibrio harveyi]
MKAQLLNNPSFLSLSVAAIERVRDIAMFDHQAGTNTCPFEQDSGEAVFYQSVQEEAGALLGGTIA